MLQYVTSKASWEELSIISSVTFNIPESSSYEYSIVKTGPNGYHCHTENNSNRVIFDILGLNAERFVKDVVGYTCVGSWPEVKTLDDLKKVIKALDDECVKKWGMPNKNTPQFKVGDIVKILPKDDSTNYLPSYMYGMEQYAGQIATIINISGKSCQINLDRGIYYWPFNALQLVNSEMDKTVDPSELKNGDYIKITSSVADVSLIYLFKEVKNNRIYRHASYFPDNKNANVNPNNCWIANSTTKITYATEEEKKLLDNVLLEQGYKWNNLTKQLDSIGLVNIGLTNTYPNGISAQPVDVSSFRNSIQKTNDMITGTLSCTKEETQTETELNLFPKKKHYQLNFNY